MSRLICAAKWARYFQWPAPVFCILLSSCGGGGGSESSPGPTITLPVIPPNNPVLDADLSTLITSQGLTGDPSAARSLVQVTPDSDEMVKLGQVLFFSQTLAGGYDVSCGSCHHPEFGMGDGLSLGVGVVPGRASAIGPDRLIEPLRDLDPAADGGPNMFRNSLTTMNTAFQDRVLLLDGRVRVVEDSLVFGGHGQNIKTPESGTVADNDSVSGLLEFQAKGAIVTDNEMRGYLYTELNTPGLYREHLLSRLKGEADTVYNSKQDAAENWLALFRDAFDEQGADAGTLITMPNIQHALGKYVESQIFVDTPWKRYVEGSTNAISEQAKEGALLFLRSKAEGGLGCSSCHAGDRFTDELFHNAGFPQIGRGLGRADTSDFGRWLVTRNDEDISAFRTLTLLNVEHTAPYGHAGTFDTLEEVVRYHANPRSQVDTFDFTLSGLGQFKNSLLSYPQSETHTRAAIAEPGFAEAEVLLPGRALSSSELEQVVAFLKTLTDSCVADENCIGQWAPGLNDDPDGHLLVKDVSSEPPLLSGVSSTADYPESIALGFPALPSRATFADVVSCENNVATAVNSGQEVFLQQPDQTFGLNKEHGYQSSTWFFSQIWATIAMLGGGITSAYLDEDCWPDLIFTGGIKSNMNFYRNIDGQMFQEMAFLAEPLEALEFSGTAVADLNGDYRRELMFGNIIGQNVPLFSLNSIGKYERIADVPMRRPTLGISFAPLDNSGHLYMYMAHWLAGGGTDGSSPSLWKNEGNIIQPWDDSAGTTSAQVLQEFNFTPKFADFTGDGNLDLVIASDFETSTVLRHVPDGNGEPTFVDETDRTVITDENGMGSTLIDIDNNGSMEWLVTSIYEDPDFVDPENEGVTGTLVPRTGNRLYESTSTQNEISFIDITDEAGIRVGHWGWGACAVDINNDGFTDIFHANGWGYIPAEVVLTPEQEALRQEFNDVSPQFLNKPSLLYINNGDRSFTSSANQWAIDVPSEGRGLSCFDYNRDGDIDIVVFNHSGIPQFFENQIGSGAGRRFLNVRLVGEQPNTDAIGSVVEVTADLGHGHGIQTQTRLSEANSNYNSQNIPDLHFGLGEAGIIDELRVDWHGGGELVCQNLPVNEFIVIDQRDGVAGCP